jgi:hypothetical protein
MVFEKMNAAAPKPSADAKVRVTVITLAQPTSLFLHIRVFTRNSCCSTTGSGVYQS